LPIREPKRQLFDSEEEKNADVPNFLKAERNKQ
jgi:hypothetical protein